MPIIAQWRIMVSKIKQVNITCANAAALSIVP